MKPLFKSRILSFGIFTLSLLSSFPAFATGVGAGGGGDKCQDRIQQVRDDIYSWIDAGGSSGLNFSKTNTNLQDYNAKMQAFIKATREHDQGSISCTDNPDEVMVDDAKKTCKASGTLDNPHILCYRGVMQNGVATGGLMGLSENDQYFQIHHEFAVLAGFEDQSKQDSDYLLSDQISGRGGFQGFLVEEMIKKLAVKPISGKTFSSTGKIPLQIQISDSVQFAVTTWRSGGSGGTDLSTLAYWHIPTAIFINGSQYEKVTEGHKTYFRQISNPSIQLTDRNSYGVGCNLLQVSGLQMENFLVKPTPFNNKLSILLQQSSHEGIFIGTNSLLLNCDSTHHYNNTDDFLTDISLAFGSKITVSHGALPKIAQKTITWLPLISNFYGKFVLVCDSGDDAEAASLPFAIAMNRNGPIIPTVAQASDSQPPPSGAPSQTVTGCQLGYENGMWEVVMNGNVISYDSDRVTAQLKVNACNNGN